MYDLFFFTFPNLQNYSIQKIKTKIINNTTLINKIIFTIGDFLKFENEFQLTCIKNLSYPKS